MKKFIIILQARGMNVNVYLSHELYKSNSWAITPILIDIINQLIKPQTKWFLLCEANSVINLKKLLSHLDAEDETKVKNLTFSQYIIKSNI